MRPVRLSAIIPATDGPSTLERCRAALERADAPPEEIVAVDGPASANAASARNLGARRSTGELLLFVDSDVEVHADAVARIRDAFAEDAGLTAVFGSYDDEPAAAGTVSAFRNLLHHHVHQVSPGPATTFWTGLGAVRREAFAAVGGFDESVAYMEDVDLGMRLAAAGRRIVLRPDIQCTHLKRWSLSGMLRTDFAHRGIPWVRLLLRHRHSAGTLNLSWRHRLSAAASVAALGSLMVGKPRAALACGAGLVALNRDFYALLLRRRGPAEAAAGIALHALHHAAGAAAVPAGIVLHLRESRAEQATAGAAAGAAVPAR